MPVDRREPAFLAAKSGMRFLVPNHEKVPTAERIGGGVAGALIVAALAFALFAPSEGANIGGGMLIMMAGLVGAACYGIGKLVGNGATRRADDRRRNGRALAISISA